MLLINPNVRLKGNIVSLEPLSAGRLEALAAIGLAPELWRFQPRAVSSVDGMRNYVQSALVGMRNGTSVPFVIIAKRSGEIIGSTRYMDIAYEHKRLEIGGTWLALFAQRTGANTEAKLLLLAHAFETLGAARVVFKTEVLNSQSRSALLRTGAVQEGVFRQHLIADDGRRRDMVYFSILDTEWPSVKQRLLAALMKYASPKQ